MTPHEIGKTILPGVAFGALAILAVLTLSLSVVLSVTASSVLASAPPNLPVGLAPFSDSAEAGSASARGYLGVAPPASPAAPSIVCSTLSFAPAANYAVGS